MSNEEQNLHTIKKCKSFHKTHKLPDLQIKIKNNQMKYNDFNSNEKYQMAHKILSTNYHQTLLLKNEEMNNKNNGKIINEKKFNSEVFQIKIKNKRNLLNLQIGVMMNH